MNKGGFKKRGPQQGGSGEPGGRGKQSIAPGKVTRTSKLVSPAVQAKAAFQALPAFVQQKPDHLADAARTERAALTAQWMDTALRPDLCPSPVQRKESSKGTHAEPERHESLPEGVRRAYGASMGADLGNVRVHTGDGVACEHGADAVTLGSDIHFDTGKYDPHSREGAALLAHELAHTVQQGAAPAVQSPEQPGSTAAMEDEADRAATAAARGDAFQVALVTPRVSQFQVANKEVAPENELGLDLDPERSSEDAGDETGASDDVAVEDPTARALAQADAVEPSAAEPDIPGVQGPVDAAAPGMAPTDAQAARAASAEAEGAPDGQEPGVSTEGAVHGQAAPAENAGGAASAGAAPSIDGSPVASAAGGVAQATAGMASMAAIQQMAAPIAAIPAPQPHEETEPAIGALAAAVHGESARHAEQVRQAAERVTTGLRARLGDVQQGIRAAHQARVAELDAGLKADRQSLAGTRAQAMTAVEADKAVQLQQLEAAQQQHTARIRAEAAQHKQTATQSVAQATAGVAAHGMPRPPAPPRPATPARPRCSSPARPAAIPRAPMPSARPIARSAARPPRASTRTPARWLRARARPPASLPPPATSSSPASTPRWTRPRRR